MSSNEARTEQLYIRVTPGEKAALRTLAVVEDYEDYSTYLREHAIDPLLEKHRRWEKLHPNVEAA